MDVAFLEWHPNGRSLFRRVRERDPKSEFSKSFITQITLDGTARTLREGRSPCLLSKMAPPQNLWVSGR